MKIRILIVDDHPLFRRGARLTISDASDMEVAGEAGSGPEALALIEKNEYDVVLLDISMPGTNGLEVLDQLKARYPRLPVLMMSFYPEEEYAVRCLRGGAAGYLTKQGPPNELIAAVRKVFRGGKYVTASLAERLAYELESGRARAPHESLSDRELQVLCLMAKGRRAKDIAADLCVSPKTIASYRARILQKMAMSSNAELVRYALKAGLAE